jgi:putative transposase
VASIFRQFLELSVTLQILVSDCVNFCAAGLRSRTALAAENLFLRKELALFREREKKAAATTAADRFVLSKLARFFKLARCFGDRQTSHVDRLASSGAPPLLALESRPVGRPPISADVRRLIHRMTAENLTWGEERIADELWLKLQIRVSPRTVESTSSKRHVLMAVKTSAGRRSSGITQMELSLAILHFPVWSRIRTH